MSGKNVCRYCKKSFKPSPYHRKQQVCFSEECRRRRDREYRRKKLADDAVYRQICADSRNNWRENNPDYQKQYRAKNQSYCEQNRQKQRERNRKRREQDRKERMSMIVKNSLAIDIKPLFTEVWMTGPLAGEVVKNNLAISQIMILQTVAPKKALSAVAAAGL
jgi:hypothetical protein